MQHFLWGHKFACDPLPLYSTEAQSVRTIIFFFHYLFFKVKTKIVRMLCISVIQCGRSLVSQASTYRQGVSTLFMTRGGDNRKTTFYGKKFCGPLSTHATKKIVAHSASCDNFLRDVGKASNFFLSALNGLRKYFS